MLAAPCPDRGDMLLYVRVVREGESGVEMREITERAAALGREVERQRFAGDDPVVALVPRLSQAEIVARVIAAERTGAALAIGEGRYSLTEDLAEAALREALGALRSWSFAVARVRLDEAARAHDPATQQRVALFKALTRHLSALIYVPLGEKLRLGLPEFDAARRDLDLLPPVESLHYRDELDRLLTLREAATGGDPFLAAAWTLVRAQLAMSAGQDEAALLWLLGLAARQAPAPEGYLAELTDRARRQILALIGEPLPDAGEKPSEAVRPRELFNALIARLGADLGRDLAQGMQYFALTEYVPAGIADEEGRTLPRRRASATPRTR